MTEAYTSPESTSAPALADADSHSSQLFHATVDPHEAFREVHNHLIHQSRVVLRLGQMPLSSGASAYRIKASMVTLAHAVGISEHRTQVTYTEIIAAPCANGTFRAGLVEQRTMGVNADRIDRLNNLVASLGGRTILTEGVARSLDEIKKIKPLYDWFLDAVASDLARAAFSFLNSEGWVECLAVAVVASSGQATRRQILHRRMNHFGIWMARGGLVVFIYILPVTPAQQPLGLGPTHQTGFISALLFLVPGFPLVTGITDLVRHDFQGRIVYLTYVFMFLVSTRVATWAVLILFHWPVTPEYPYVLSLWFLYTLRVLIGLITAFGFAMLFDSPLKVAAVAAITGALINTACPLLVNKAHAQASAAVGLATLAAGLFTIFAAPKTRFSQVTLPIPVVVTMIPGVPLYRSLTYLNNGQTIETLAALFTVVFTITGIGIGLAVARTLTDRS